MDDLTPKQRATLTLVRKGRRFNLRELASLSGKSYGACRHHAAALEAAGYFERVAGGGRGVELFLRRSK